MRISTNFSPLIFDTLHVEIHPNGTSSPLYKVDLLLIDPSIPAMMHVHGEDTDIDKCINQVHAHGLSLAALVKHGGTPASPVSPDKETDDDASLNDDIPF